MNKFVKLPSGQGAWVHVNVSQIRAINSYDTERASCTLILGGNGEHKLMAYISLPADEVVRLLAE